jgi:hypothetical protein
MIAAREPENGESGRLSGNIAKLPVGNRSGRAQSRRYRRRRNRRSKDETGGARIIARKFFVVHLDRPGCYEEFQPSRRSPLQRFCSYACRGALERVLPGSDGGKNAGQVGNEPQLK